jgi:hypothetical protein
MGNKTKTKPVSWRGRYWIRGGLEGSVPIDETSATLRHYGFTRVAGDVPFFRWLIRRNTNASGNLSVNVSNAEVSDLVSESQVRVGTSPSSPDWNKVTKFGLEGAFQGANVPEPISSHSGSPSMVKANAIAIRCLQSKWTKRRRQFSGGVFLGELGKTIMMVIRPAKALRAKLSSFSQRASKIAKRRARGDSVTKVLADTWLESVFGWKPLISDIQDGALALARTVEKDVLERHQFRCFGQDEVTLNPFATPFRLGLGLGDVHSFIAYTHTVARAQMILYGVWCARVADSALASSSARRLATLSGFNWEDIPSQAWELVPWSFVVDYFSNVGDVIESAANTLNGPLWIEQVQITETETIRDIVPDPSDAAQFYGARFISQQSSNSRSRSSYRTILRGAYGGSFQTDLSFRLPIGTQWLNLAALAAGGRSFQPFSNR